MAINKPIKKAIRILSSDNLFTDSAELKGYFNLSVSGTFVATVTVQRSFDSGDTWLDVKSVSAKTEEYGFETESGVVYRVGIKEGGYTSGQVFVRISQ